MIDLFVVVLESAHGEMRRYLKRFDRAFLFVTFVRAMNKISQNCSFKINIIFMKYLPEIQVIFLATINNPQERSV